MAEHTVQLVLHYDGAGFAGWQRQPDTRTVQGVLEAALTRLCNRETQAIGAGRTDAGVHARGQAVGTRVPDTWPAPRLRRALNAILPDDVWVAAAFDMAPQFHARYRAISRRYSYRIGTDDASRSPFRRRYEWYVEDALDRTVLRDAADAIRGEHCFRAYAVHGTAPATDDHRCDVTDARWCEGQGALVFEISANRFLHHMVRFLVGTMVDAARGRREPGDVERLDRQ
jgi:tRNA pseudouridine38-40 synthase